MHRRQRNGDRLKGIRGPASVLGPFPGVVLIHHLPGWSELYIETDALVRASGLSRDLRQLYQRERRRAADGDPDELPSPPRWVAEGGHRRLPDGRATPKPR